MSFEAFFGETRTWAGVIHVYSYVRGGIPPPLPPLPVVEART